MKKKVAIFDVDGTVFRSSLLIELVKALIEKGIFPRNAEKEFEREERRWQNREGDYETYIRAIIEVFMNHIKGVPYGAFADVSEVVVKKNGKRLYRYTRDLVLSLKKRGYFLLAISQSPKGILDKFCKSLGFDKVYGRIYELGPNDEFTGVVVDEHLIANKSNIVKRAIEKENLTLTGSIGVGDTEGDIPVLEMVEKAICFNPNAKLLKIAKINKWNVIVERKDVIYTIAP
jgi:HAD superfamily hydrolase (TIGR01490 family)